MPKDYVVEDPGPKKPGRKSVLGRVVPEIRKKHPNTWVRLTKPMKHAGHFHSQKSKYEGLEMATRTRPDGRFDVYIRVISDMGTSVDA